MTTASEVAEQIVSAETDAVVSAAAAQTAVVAADAAVTLAQEQTAIVTAQAAAVISDAVGDIEQVEDDVSWLKRNVTELQNLVALLMARLEVTEAQILSLKSEASQSQTPQESPPLESVNLEVVNPQSVAVDAQPEVPAASAPPSKPRLKRL